ncbi:MAG: N-6 DNA methylase [Calditrichaeota bacterium]|nr:N-6 DNA methylase [Calditrichota bacterium]
MPSKSLQIVDFLNANGKPTPGLVRIPENLSESGCENIGEIAALNAAKSFDTPDKKCIDYVFFRRFSDGRSSQIAAYIVDNSNNRLTEPELAELHSKVWIQGLAPLLYVSRSSQIDLLTCARGSDFWKADEEENGYKPVWSFKVNALTTASEISKELRNISAFRLADGTFWEDPDNIKLANYQKAAHKSLIQAVVDADIAINGKDKPVQRRLLLLIVLIKYLEDRKVFPSPEWFGEFYPGATCFFDVLKGGNPNDVFQLLDFLERKFNGDIFSFNSDEKQSITSQVLTDFAYFVEAKTLKCQRYLWKQFSFEHLPVEIISHLYQRFVKKKDDEKSAGEIYTPPVLAALLLDQTMPYDKLSGKERVLDPACGSGIFLVGAFKRLINVWRNKHKWKPLDADDLDELKNILRDCIFGIDVDSIALQLTAFSLSLAICDALQPEIIWKNLRFEPLLKSNLLKNDFFQELLNLKNGTDTVLKNKFDIIIGNPPFIKLTPPAEEINQTMCKDSHRGELPEKQLAYLFLEQTIPLLKKSGKCCLIQPTGLLYNSGTRIFRTKLLRDHRIETIFDIISIRGLFEDADTKVIAVLAHAESPPKDHLLNHWTFRRTRSIKERICFELDHYDRHRISQKEAESDPFVWRVNLLGGGRLLNISRHLRDMPTLAEYLERKKKEKGWDYGEGFVVGKTEDKKRVLTGKPFLERTIFDSDDINSIRQRIESDNETVKYTHFNCKIEHKKKLFSPPLILMKLILHFPILFWNEGFVGYRKGIVGIHAPHDETTNLYNLYNTICQKRDFYKFSCVLNGYEALSGNATSIGKQDIDLFPYPKDLSDLDFTFWEQVLRDDVLNYMTDYVRFGQNSDLLKKAATPYDTQKYAELFVKMLGTIYDNLQASDAIFLKGLICQPFYFGERPNLSWVEQQDTKKLKKLIYKEENHGFLRNIRILRYYDKNVLLLIKPDRLRYWIRSTAIRDADEALIDLNKQGF